MAQRNRPVGSPFRVPVMYYHDTMFHVVEKFDDEAIAGFPPPELIIEGMVGSGYGEIVFGHVERLRVRLCHLAECIQQLREVCLDPTLRQEGNLDGG